MHPTYYSNFSCVPVVHLWNVCQYLQRWNKVLSNYQSQNCRVIKSPSWLFQGKNVWVNSRSWWWTGRPGVLRFMRLKKVGHDWATELNETDIGTNKQHVKKQRTKPKVFSGKICIFWKKTENSPGLGIQNCKRVHHNFMKWTFLWIPKPSLQVKFTKQQLSSL